MISASGGGRLLADMSPRDRRALVLVIAFLVCIVGYTQGIEPLLFRFENALNRLDRSEQLSAGYIQKIRMLPRRETRLAELEQEKSSVDEYFAPDPASNTAPADALIHELSSYSNISGARILQLTPDVESLANNSARFHGLVLAGDYSSIRRYLYLLETSPRKFQLVEFELNPSKEDVLRAKVRFLDPTPVQATTVTGHGVGESKHLVVGVYGTESDLPIYVAQAEKHFEAAGLKVGLVPAGTPDNSLRLLLSGQIDAVTASVYDLLRYRLEGAPVRAVIPMGRPPLEAHLVTAAGSSISRLDGLNGKTIGLELHGMVEPLLLQLLDVNAMGRDDVRLVYLDRRALIRHLRSGLIEAGLISGLEKDMLDHYELTLIETLSAGAAGWQSFLVVHEDILEHKHRQLVDLAQAIFEANKMLTQSTDSARAAAAHWLGNSKSQSVESILERTEFLQSEEAWTLMSTKTDDDIMLGAVQQLLLELGEDVPDITKQDLVDARVMEEYLQSERVRAD